MKLIFRIENDWLFKSGEQSFKVDWNLPVLPRIGERVHPLLILNQINGDIDMTTLNVTSEAQETYDRTISVKAWLHDIFASYGCRITDIRYMPVSRNSKDIETVIYFNQNIYE